MRKIADRGLALHVAVVLCAAVLCSFGWATMLNTDMFIKEISTRPPLWDNTRKDYSNKDLKFQLWCEVAAVVIASWDRLPNDEKNKQVEELQKRWRSLRDTFRKELKNQKKTSGSGQTKKKKYCYFNQMLFLIGATAVGESISNLPNQEKPVKEDSTVTPLMISSPETEKKPTSAKRVKNTEPEKAVMTQVKPADEETEADKQFLLSLLPTMKKLPLEKKLWARMAITQVMLQAFTNGAMIPHSQPSHFSITNVPNCTLQSQGNSLTENVCSVSEPSYSKLEKRGRQDNIHSPSSSDP